MINKNLLPFLQFRDQILDISALENQYGISLPPIYKSFISVFKPFFFHHAVKKTDGRLVSFLALVYSSKELIEYSIDDDELALESFKEVEEVLSFEPSNKGYLTDYLYIANHGYAGGLLVGIGKKNKDQIFHSLDNTIIEFVADNIYQVLQKIHLVEFNFEEPIDLSKVYKKWGDKYWEKGNIS